jgi:heterotetrameric sarcosine oxidase delta subunit
MQQFPCPFCGSRDEREFQFAGEAGKVRPDTSNAVSDQAWANYLHTQRNEFGEATEIWRHLTCQEMFILKRDTFTMEVLGSVALRKDRL